MNHHQGKGLGNGRSETEASRELASAGETSQVFGSVSPRPSDWLGLRRNLVGEKHSKDVQDKTVDDTCALGREPIWPIR